MKVNLSVLIVVLLESFVSGSAVGTASLDEKPMKSALLVIDIQNEYLPMIPEQERILGLQMINQAGGRGNALIPDERPPGMGYHAMAYDAESKRVILFGGQTGDPETETSVSAETWAYDPLNNRWQKMEPVAGPPAMSAHAMAYDSESDRVILHGGGGAYDKDRLEELVFRQTWAYDFNNNSWTKMSDGPPRIGHRMAYDAESDRVVMFSGGCFRDGRFRDVQETWTYDFNSDAWSEMKPARSPAARHYHGLAYDPTSDRVILWGGFISKEARDSRVWAYDVNSNAWLEFTPDSGPDPRPYHAMACDELSEQMIIYGGGDDGSDETWAYDIRKNSWAKLLPANAPGKISRMPMVYIPEMKRLVLFGGQFDSRRYAYSDATWSYNPEASAWTDVSPRREEPLGRKDPGLTPGVFGPGIISGKFIKRRAVADFSTPEAEDNQVFPPDRNQTQEKR